MFLTSRPFNFNFTFHLWRRGGSYGFCILAVKTLSFIISWWLLPQEWWFDFPQLPIFHIYFTYISHRYLSVTELYRSPLYLWLCVGNIISWCYKRNRLTQYNLIIVINVPYITTVNDLTYIIDICKVISWCYLLYVYLFTLLKIIY